MDNLNYIAVSVAVIASFVASGIYYSLFAKKRRALSLVPNPEASRPKPKLLLLEILRNFVLAVVLAYFIDRLHLTTFADALWYSAIMWLAFPFMLLTGSVMYEKFPAKLAVIHMGDWAIKLPLLMIIITLWR